MAQKRGRGESIVATVAIAIKGVVIPLVEEDVGQYEVLGTVNNAGWQARVC